MAEDNDRKEPMTEQEAAEIKSWMGKFMDYWFEYMKEKNISVTKRETANAETENRFSDIKFWIPKILSYWYLYVIFVVIAVAVGIFYNKSAVPVYQARTTVLIKDKGDDLDPTMLITNIRTGYQGPNISNEMGILTSYALTDRAVRIMNAEVSYFNFERRKPIELYKKSPFTVEFDRNTLQVVGNPYEIIINDNSTFTLKARNKLAYVYNYQTEKLLGVTDCTAACAEQKTYNFGEWIDNGINRFRIVLNDNYNPERSNNVKMGFIMFDYISLVKLHHSFGVEQISKQSSIVAITMKGNNINKIVDFLNTLADQYISRGLEAKNIVSENTILFIDRQLMEISDSLNLAERDLRDFQADAVVMDVSHEASQTYAELKKLESEKAELELKLKYYNNIRSYISDKIDNLDKLIAPSAMGIQDQLLNRLVQDLVNLTTLRSTQLITSTEMNPNVIAIDERIESTKRSLVENINNMISNTEMSVSTLDMRIGKIENQMKMLPSTQRDYLNYKRKYDLNNTIYNFLLKKRSEAQIVKASNTPDNEVLDKAHPSLVIRIAPRTMVNLLIALLIGLIIPTIYIVLAHLLNIKVMEAHDVETSCPNSIIVGQIPQNRNTSPTIVIDGSKSPAAESFRTLRTNCDFLLQGREKGTILVTGDRPGIGKTYISINIASIYALYERRTVLIGFDLRKPRIYQEFELNNQNGITNYLLNKATLDDIIFKGVKLPYLDIITAGSIPPNPAELIASKRCEELFKELKERYDYIIVDTPPMGLVTDSVLLMKHSDVNLFIVRQGVSYINSLRAATENLNELDLKVSIVFNGLRQDGRYGYRYGYGNRRYGYGYGYSYGYGYGSEYSSYYGLSDTNKKKRHRFIKRILDRL